jgi:hypothetical protein
LALLCNAKNLWLSPNIFYFGVASQREIFGIPCQIFFILALLRNAKICGFASQNHDEIMIKS